MMCIFMNRILEPDSSTIEDGGSSPAQVDDLSRLMKNVETYF